MVIRIKSLLQNYFNERKATPCSSLLDVQLTTTQLSKQNYHCWLSLFSYIFLPSCTSFIHQSESMWCEYSSLSQGIRQSVEGFNSLKFRVARRNVPQLSLVKTRDQRSIEVLIICFPVSRACIRSEEHTSELQSR